MLLGHAALSEPLGDDGGYGLFFGLCDELSIDQHDVVNRRAGLPFHQVRSIIWVLECVVLIPGSGVTGLDSIMLNRPGLFRSGSSAPGWR